MIAGKLLKNQDRNYFIISVKLTFIFLPPGNGHFCIISSNGTHLRSRANKTLQDKG